MAINPGKYDRGGEGPGTDDLPAGVGTVYVSAEDGHVYAPDARTVGVAGTVVRTVARTVAGTIADPGAATVAVADDATSRPGRYAHVGHCDCR